MESACVQSMQQTPLSHWRQKPGPGRSCLGVGLAGIPSISSSPTRYPKEKAGTEHKVSYDGTHQNGPFREGKSKKYPPGVSMTL